MGWTDFAVANAVLHYIARSTKWLRSVIVVSFCVLYSICNPKAAHTLLEYGTAKAMREVENVCRRVNNINNSIHISLPP